MRESRRKSYFVSVMKMLCFFVLFSVTLLAVSKTMNDVKCGNINDHYDCNNFARDDERMKNTNMKNTTSVFSSVDSKLFDVEDLDADIDSKRDSEKISNREKNSNNENNKNVNEGIESIDNNSTYVKTRVFRALASHRHHHKHKDYKDRYYNGSDYVSNDFSQARQREGTSLSDVWLCLACALGWCVWMVNSFLQVSDLDRYQKDSVLVRGHVLEVSIEDDVLGTGIPTYHALIDYRIKKQSSAEPIQVRKQFQTQHLLRQGFANVELLVLPEEPTLSVIKEDFQREVLETQAQLAELEKSAFSGDPDDVCTYYDDAADDFVNIFNNPSRFEKLAKYGSLTLSAILIVASLAGAIGTVQLIESSRQQMFGWISLVVSVALLWPGALLVLEGISKCSQYSVARGEKSGIIMNSQNSQQGVRSATSPTSDADLVAKSKLFSPARYGEQKNDTTDSSGEEKQRGFGSSFSSLSCLSRKNCRRGGTADLIRPLAAKGLLTPKVGGLEIKEDIYDNDNSQNYYVIFPPKNPILRRESSSFSTISANSNFTNSSMQV